ncbi:hypothetical protein D3C72_559490 [compost metagenome]
MSEAWPNGRRAFLARMGTWTGAALVAGAMRPSGAHAAEEEVSPPEDLMREHGVLNRILLIYEDALCRLGGCRPFEAEPVRASADIVRRFIEGYYEKLEEQYLFPRFRKAHTLVDLVDTLEAQHKAGRGLTETVLALSTPGVERDQARSERLSAAMEAFIRMYRPHEAREDTVLFPALRAIVSPHEFDALGETFENREHALFGREGFEGVVAQVAELEKRLGIHDLAQFTPGAPG